ncbi:unnamed protein product [Brassicogethes aeneus]|uniref:Transcription factor Adf-1 n=1 Tax=Brassicogethes aeneus TaxID=1431903 RepID=A0A9P0B3P9_BRAAE|nr:unnamed protein product [Brassicogethes aeneus]
MDKQRRKPFRKMDNCVDNNLLISLILARPPIWNINHRSYRNRNVIERCWRDISSNMGVNKYFLRKRWKNLRDHFRSELAKVQNPDEKGTKWEHFNSLLFLKDVVKQPKNTENQDKNYIDDEQYEPYLETEDDAKNDFDEPEYVQAENFKNDIDYSDYEMDPDSLADSVYKKRRFEENEDELFFKSLLPHCKRIPDHTKLLFRNKVMLLVNEFAYEDGNKSENPSSSA